MKLILLNDVKGLGKAGEMVNAKTGYARNFLIPNHHAIEATKENMKEWEEKKAIKEKRDAEERAKALKLKEQLENLVLIIPVKTGGGDKLFGSITSMDIANALEKQQGITIDKKRIEMKENIKSISTNHVPVRVYPEIVAELKVVIEKA